MKNQFKNIISDFQGRDFSHVITRDYDIPVNVNKIVSLIGVRRCGKTYVLYDLIHQLRQIVDLENIVYVNFEDDRLFPISLHDLDDLINAYYEMYPEKRKEKVYFFFDEVQNIKNWELFIRRIYDTLDVQIFITGSSSKLLASELATSLRGRTITYEIFPFSFKEYLDYKNIKINLHASKSISFIKNAFNTYLFNGGFAETFDVDKSIRRRILKDYMDMIIYKDLIDRYAIKNHVLLKHLIKYFFVNMGTLMSFNKLYNQYKSMGYKIGKETLFDYLSFLQEAFAVFTPTIYRDSVKAENRHPRKLFVIDNGFKALFDMPHSDDYSKLYENQVFLHLRRFTNEIYYYKVKQEVDFYVKTKSQLLINVCYDISDINTFQREINALNEGMDYFKLKKSYLITSEREEVLNIDNKEIQIIPLWKWMLTVPC